MIIAPGVYVQLDEQQYKVIDDLYSKHDGEGRWRCGFCAANISKPEGFLIAQAGAHAATFALLGKIQVKKLCLDCGGAIQKVIRQRFAISKRRKK